MRPKARDITQEYLKKYVTFDPVTGLFHWLQRTAEDFTTDNFRDRWNRDNAGKVAGWKMVHGYWCIEFKGYRFPAHRLAWFFHYGVFPDCDIDHINNVRTDNRIANLRLATRSQNLQNAKLRSNNTSGHKNVSFRKDTGKWAVRMRKYQGKYLNIGNFDCVEDAVAAATKARQELYKEFANHG
jgi:hypothetical protein